MIARALISSLLAAAFAAPASPVGAADVVHSVVIVEVAPDSLLYFGHDPDDGFPWSVAVPVGAVILAHVAFSVPSDEAGGLFGGMTNPDVETYVAVDGEEFGGVEVAELQGPTVYSSSIAGRLRAPGAYELRVRDRRDGSDFHVLTMLAGEVSG